MDKSCHMTGKKELFSYGNNSTIVIQIKILQPHSFLPLKRSLSVTDSTKVNRYFENPMISGMSHDRATLQRLVYSTVFLVSIKLKNT